MTGDSEKMVAEFANTLATCELQCAEGREQIAAHLKVVRFAQGETLFTEGEEGDYLGIITSGRLEVTKRAEFEGRNVVVTVLKKGAVVGELTFVDDQPRSATVQALEDSELLVLSRADMDELAREYPQAAMALLRGINRILSLRLRKAVDKLAGIF